MPLTSRVAAHSLGQVVYRVQTAIYRCLMRISHQYRQTSLHLSVRCCNCFTGTWIKIIIVNGVLKKTYFPVYIEHRVIDNIACQLKIRWVTVKVNPNQSNSHIKIVQLLPMRLIKIIKITHRYNSNHGCIFHCWICRPTCFGTIHFLALIQISLLPIYGVNEI